MSITIETLPASNSFEENVRHLVESYQRQTEEGHGLFFDFSATPEYEKPVLDRLKAVYGWIQERPDFIRKQEAPLN